MPTLPGGLENHLSVLRNVLEAVDEAPDQDALVPWPSSKVRVPAAKAADQLAPAGLLRRLTDHRVELTDQARQYLASPNDVFLITLFHQHVKFVGEFLSELKMDGITREKLREIAAQKYHLGWKTLDQIDRRYAWLQATGMVDLRYDHNLVLTEIGESFLANLTIVDPATLNSGLAYVDVHVDPATLPRADSRIQEMLENITDERLRRRFTPTMYIPKGRSSPCDSPTSLRIQLDGISPRITRSDYIRLCEAEFGSRDGTATSALDTLRHTGLVQQTGRDTFDTTEAAQAWLESGENLDLARILHVHVRCMGELIGLLQEAISIGELTQKVDREYGISLTAEALRRRLQILRECELIYQPTQATYLATARGKAFASTLPLEASVPAEDWAFVQKQAQAEDRGTVPLAEELSSAAKDFKHPARFEEAVVRAFRTLGLAADHLGGSGDTDVLVTIHKTPTSKVKVIVDTKATSHSSVLENAVDFTTLEEHRRQHDATYVALVAVGFEAGRIVKRARANNVALIKVDELIAILARQATAPLTPVELLALFDVTENDPWGEADRRNSMMKAVIIAIAEEAEYVEESGQSFSVKDIHKSVRRELDRAPSLDEIRNMLDFLASPLIEGVTHDGRDGYQPGITVEGIAARLRALANAGLISKDR